MFDFFLWNYIYIYKVQLTFNPKLILIVTIILKGRFDSGEVRLLSEIKLLTDYNQNTVESKMFEILDNFCLVNRE